MKPYPISESEAEALRRIATASLATSPTPPEAGNIHLPDLDDDDDIVDWWPVTGKQVFVFWSIVMAAVLAVVLITVFAPGYMQGFSTLQIIQTILTWGLQ